MISKTIDCTQTNKKKSLTIDTPSHPLSTVATPFTPFYYRRPLLFNALGSKFDTPFFLQSLETPPSSFSSQHEKDAKIFVFVTSCAVKRPQCHPLFSEHISSVNKAHKLL